MLAISTVSGVDNYTTHQSTNETTTTAAAGGMTESTGTIQLPSVIYESIKNQWAEITTKPTITTTTAAEAAEAAAELCAISNVKSVLDTADNSIYVTFDTAVSSPTTPCINTSYELQYSTDNQFRDTDNIAKQPIDHTSDVDQSSDVINNLVPSLTYYIQVQPVDTNNASIAGKAVKSDPFSIRIGNSQVDIPDDQLGYQVLITLYDDTAFTQSSDELSDNIANQLASLLQVQPSRFNAISYSSTDNVITFVITPGTEPAAQLANTLRTHIVNQSDKLSKQSLLKQSSIFSGVQAVQQCDGGQWSVGCAPIDGNNTGSSSLPPPDTSNSSEMEDAGSLPVTPEDTKQENVNTNTNNSSPGTIVVPDDNNAIYDRDTGLVFGLSPLLLLAMIGGVVVVGGYAYVTRQRSNNPYTAVNNTSKGNNDIFDDNNYDNDIEMAITTNKSNNTSTRPKPMDSSSDIDENDDDDGLSMNISTNTTYIDKLCAISDTGDNSAIQLAECVMSNLSIPSYGHTTYTKKLTDQSITTIQQLRSLTSTDYKTLNLPFVIEDAIKKALHSRDNILNNNHSTNGSHNINMKPRVGGLSLTNHKTKLTGSKPKKLAATVIDIDDNDEFGLNMNNTNNYSNLHQSNNSSEWDDLELNLSSTSTTNNSSRNGIIKSLPLTTKKSTGKSTILLADDYDHDDSDAFEDF